MFDHHPNVLSPPCNKATLRRLVLACTSSCLFLNHVGEKYKQTDGGAVGCPFGVNFARYCMTDIEIIHLKLTQSSSLQICGRLIHVVESHGHLERLIQAFRSNSVVSFIIEESEINKFNFLHFLDIENFQ